ncbi:telomere-protecting terminal protein Tpg [Streptomyces sp. NPDC059979]|uniref:telomere-protecting terminal protein Tpg n=1 Tax=unclassified Streptomyces TaxID=2593676 RepID=UPI00364B713B
MRERFPISVRAAKAVPLTTDGVASQQLHSQAQLRFGYPAPVGSTDDGRMRRLTVHLPPAYAQRLFDAQQQGTGDQELRAIVAERLQEVYFKDGGPADHLEVITRR